MPDLTTRGTKGSDLTYQQGDEQIAHPVTPIAVNTNLDETHNREILVVTAAVSLTLPVALTLETALDSTATALEKVGWYVTVINNVAGNVTIDATTNTVNINGTSADLVIGQNKAVTIAYDLTSNGYFIASSNDPLMVTTTGTQTLTNKTLTAPVINTGTDAEGDIYYRDASGDFIALPAGTSGYVLQTNGVGAAPTWVAAGGGIFTESYVSSSATAITGGNNDYSEAHGLSGIPKLYSIHLRCTDAGGDIGYSQNDEIDMKAHAPSTQGKSIWADASNVGYSMVSVFSGTVFTNLFCNKTGGSASLDITKWGWVVRAYY